MEAVTVMTPATSRRSSRMSSLARWTSETAAELPMSQKSSTRLSDVLTCWPPGPEERENRQPSSEAGIVSTGDTSRSMHQALHTTAPGESPSGRHSEVPLSDELPGETSEE